MGFDPEALVLSHQTHTTNVRLVTREDRGRGYTKPPGYTDVDGLITDVPGLVLATFYADCVPLFSWIRFTGPSDCLTPAGRGPCTAWER